MFNLFLTICILIGIYIYQEKILDIIDNITTYLSFRSSNERFNVENTSTKRLLEDRQKRLIDSQLPPGDGNTSDNFFYA